MTFGPETYDRSSPYEANIGQEVIASFNGNNMYGVLESVKGGSIILNPCLVNQPSDNGEYVNKLMNRPSVFPMQGTVVLPVDGGSIDTILENQEKKLQKENMGDKNGC